VTWTPNNDVNADESTLTMTDAIELNAQLQQLEINATNCVRDLASLVSTLDAALREVNGIASEHMAQLSAASDQLASGVEGAVSAADALVLQCGELRNKLAQCDSLARTTAEIRRQVMQLDQLVDRSTNR
jgi:Cu/Ag efflux pump CusA